MNTIKNWIPNILTLCNLLCGMLSCWISARVIPNYLGENNSGYDLWVYLSPSILIIGAAVIDFLDGFAARLLKVHSELGKQLDSLADMVSFGVAPAFIILGYNLMGVFSPLGLFIAIFACVRLAKFNIDTRQTDSFLGLPVPSTGLIVASLLFVNLDGQLAFLLNPWVIGALIFILCMLMVSEIPLLALKFKTFGLKENIWRYAIIAFAILMLSLFGFQSFTFIILAYVSLSLISQK